MQSQTKDEMFTVLEKYHQILQNENMKAAPDKSHFFLRRVKFFGHIIEKNTITPLKSLIDAIQKLQPPTNKNKNQEYMINEVFNLHDPLDTIPLSKIEVENIFPPTTELH